MAGENTKQCEVCDAEIGKDEKICPKCKTDFEELEETVSAVDRANTVSAKRKAKAAPVPAPAAEQKPLKGIARLRAFGKLVKRA